MSEFEDDGMRHGGLVSDECPECRIERARAERLADIAEGYRAALKRIIALAPEPDRQPIYSTVIEGCVPAMVRVAKGSLEDEK